MFAPTPHLYRSISNAAWTLAQAVNRGLPEGTLPTPKWAPGRLLKRQERTPMATGVPRRTLSLCPDCNREAAEAVLRGERDITDFREYPGIVDAEIIEECGRILMRKACDAHGPFEDVLSNHPDFFRRMEELAFGGDFDCVGDRDVHNHGPNSIRAGRGTYLIVDLTNRCNMICSPCYMDANATNYVHELDIEDIKAIFNNAVSFKPQREINVLFSGGEATLSPVFLDAVQYAKSMGFHRLHVATNGIRFAESRDFAFEAKEAGLHAVYLQLDGVTEERNKHRGLRNYMEVKLRALENIAAAGMQATLQVTVVNGLNNDGVGDIVRFAVQNIQNIHGVVFQPVMLTGRDEGISAEERYARRYPLSQLAYDLQKQSSFHWQPLRDWFPASAYAVFAHLCDVLNPDAPQGSLYSDMHPDHAVLSPLLVDAVKKDAMPLAAFFNLEQFFRDIAEITDSGRGPTLTKAMVSLSLLRNFDQRKAPSGFGITQFRDLLEDCFYRVAGADDDWSQKARSHNHRWRIIFLNGVWFQDTFNYDLSTASNSNIVVGTQEGEISFCAYNAAGWRKIVEHTHRIATLPAWYGSHPRHAIYAKGKTVDLARARTAAESSLVQIDLERSALPAGNVGPRD